MKTIYGILFLMVLMSFEPLAHTQPAEVTYVVIEREYADAAKRYNVDARLFKAVLYAESNLDHAAVNPDTLDFGIGQINYKTAEYYKIDTHRLTHDRAYSIDRAAFVLSKIKRYNRSKLPESKAWVCHYNVGGKVLSGNRAAACAKYLKRIKYAYEVNQLGGF